MKHAYYVRHKTVIVTTAYEKHINERTGWNESLAFLRKDQLRLGGSLPFALNAFDGDDGRYVVIAYGDIRDFETISGILESAGFKRSFTERKLTKIHYTVDLD